VVAVSGDMNEPLSDDLLRDIWYFALPSAALKAGSLVARTLLGEPVVFGRGSDGLAFALRDICPHRGIPLSDGRMTGAEVECCYHGWRFAADGVCTAIPSLVAGQDMDVSRIRVQDYPISEAQGCIWIFMPSDAARAIAPPPAPVLAEVADVVKVTEVMEFPCHVDHAVVGLMDPAHGPFVHKSWWWRSRRSIHAKEKRFGPSELGFSMLRHAPSSNSAAYKILGGEMTTEISFRLPGIRVEHVKAGRNALVGLTAVTPITRDRTMVHQLMYWTMPWLTALRPVLRPFVRKFLNQDREIVMKQQKGLAHQPNLLLINDADMQAKWYYRLKKAYSRSVNEGTAFENPVRETTLRWRS
jgi:phenylpropionate dioxygenase-like ring-hydroxylating dioxygenase large terminal subunit